MLRLLFLATFVFRGVLARLPAFALPVDLVFLAIFADLAFLATLALLATFLFAPPRDADFFFFEASDARVREVVLVLRDARRPPPAFEDDFRFLLERFVLEVLLVVGTNPETPTLPISRNGYIF